MPTLTCREGQDCRRGGEAADRDAGDGGARTGSKGGAGPVTVICRRYQHADVVVLIPRMAWHGIASFQLRVSSLSARFWRVSGLSGVRLACVCSNKLHGLRYQPAPSLVPRPSWPVFPGPGPGSGHRHGKADCRSREPAGAAPSPCVFAPIPGPSQWRQRASAVLSLRSARAFHEWIRAASVAGARAPSCTAPARELRASSSLEG